MVFVAQVGGSEIVDGDSGIGFYGEVVLGEVGGCGVVEDVAFFGVGGG